MVFALIPVLCAVILLTDRGLDTVVSSRTQSRCRCRTIGTGGGGFSAVSSSPRSQCAADLVGHVLQSSRRVVVEGFRSSWIAKVPTVRLPRDRRACPKPHALKTQALLGPFRPPFAFSRPLNLLMDPGGLKASSTEEQQEVVIGI